MRVARRLSILSACLVTMSVLMGHLNDAAAQQPEKRIALVVGNGAYAQSPLATAVNDAGLIAQTLQAAGFDVIGARDLDGDTLRRSFRDFIQKAESSGPDTVAMVYLAGYGLQLAGDNYFVPVDSANNRETDVPIEALRTGDYIRQLASLPLKAGIVVLDAARQQPFVNGQIASGLALVEADPHMLIAFNAAPGTCAPAEQGPYGIYAQSLAEMIRTGGLPLPEVFNRLRLRVNETSKGAQVPWDSQKVDAGFTFFERAPDAPAPAAPDQAAAVKDKPIRDLGVQDAYAAALERDTLQGYEEFLGAYAGDPLAKRVRAIAAARRRSPGAAPIAPIRRTPTGRICSAIRVGRMPLTRAAGSPFSPRRSSRRRHSMSSITTCRRRRPKRSSISTAPCWPLATPSSTLSRRRRRRSTTCRRRRMISWCWSHRRRRSGCSSCRSRCSCRSRSMSGRRAMWRRRRTTSSSPTSTTAPSSTTSSTGEGRLHPRRGLAPVAWDVPVSRPGWLRPGRAVRRLCCRLRSRNGPR